MAYVLIVEDNIDVRALTLLALQEKGYRCVGAANGLEALNFMCDPQRDALPFLILLDLNMPVMTGQQFIRVVEKCSEMSSIPIVIISGSPGVPEGYQVMKKPLGLDDLYTIVETHFQEGGSRHPCVKPVI